MITIVATIVARLLYRPQIRPKKAEMNFVHGLRLKVRRLFLNFNRLPYFGSLRRKVGRLMVPFIDEVIA